MASSVVAVTQPPSKPAGAAVEGFPKAFLASMKVLFDILDEDADGLVHIAEIEKRWAAEGATTGLPFGVLNGLRKATPKNGKLSFERFCGGLKMSLNFERGVGRGREDSKQPNTATVRPNNVVRPMAVRTRSAPQLPQAREQSARPRSLSNNNNTDQVTDWELAVQKARHMSEDKIHSGKYRVREDLTLKRRSAPGNINTNGPSHAHHPRIQQESNHHHHRAPRRNEGEYNYVQYPPAQAPRHGPHYGHGKEGPKPARAVNGPVYDHPRSPVEAKPVNGHISSERRSPSHSPKQKSESKEKSKRGDPRRHTVTNGIDYNLLKRMKQLEQERDVLLQGMEVAERSRDWYQRQLAYVRQKQPGYSGNSQFTHGEDSPASGQQDRLAYRMSRILEINRQLTHLMENPEKDFPDHMNLALASFQPPPAPSKQRMSSTSSSSSMNSNLIAQLREQNKLLTKEVSEKSEAITQLEKDKAALIRQLFEARGKKHQNNNHKEMPNNTTFI